MQNGGLQVTGRSGGDGHGRQRGFAVVHDLREEGDQRRIELPVRPPGHLLHRIVDGERGSSGYVGGEMIEDLRDTH